MGLYTKTIIILCIISTAFFTGQYLDNSSLRTLHSTADVDSSQVSSGEYLRSGSYRSTATGKLSYTGADTVEITDRHGTSMTLHCECPKSSAEIELPLFNYKGYVITDGSGSTYDITDGKENVIKFTLPKGFSGDVTVEFREPPLWRISEAVTLISIAALIAAAVILKKKNSPRRSGAKR